MSGLLDVIKNDPVLAVFGGFLFVVGILKIMLENTDIYFEDILKVAGAFAFVVLSGVSIFFITDLLRASS